MRAEAYEEVEVGCTVNGSAVSMRVPPRVTLADALREHLGLTGTHLGCEHGVCGMCTVLVDGAAARACLLFAVQCEGAEIVTVEGLGSPDGQHPLQQAFSHHHALQCGFCTPGFLMSAYDLLADGGVEPESLPTELSGVLCRCTGYRGIVAAVADVAAAYPDGLPAPLNCSQRPLVGRRGVSGARPAAAASTPEAVRSDVDVAVPTGAPSATVDVSSEIAAPVEAVWAVLDDPERLARCLPGAELTDIVDERHYVGRATVALGPVRLSFRGVARILERDVAAHRMRVVARGADAGGSSTQADIRLAVDPSGQGSRLHAEADVFLSGRIAQFGRALAGDVSRRLFEQFAQAVEQTATTGSAPEPAGMSGTRLAVQALVARLRAALRR